MKFDFTQDYETYEKDGAPIIAFNIPKDLAHDYVNNKKELYKFK